MAKNAMKNVAAEFTFRHRLNQVSGKSVAEQQLQFEFESLALKLLGPLFSLSTQFLNLADHSRNLRFLLRDFGF